MIVDNKNNYIFYHIPRTGGTSIEKALGGRRGGATHQHFKTISNWNEYFTFAFIRNPWSRTLSCYFMWGNKDLTFEETILNRTPHPHKPPDRWKKDLEGIDFVGRFEFLEEDFDKICKIIGIERPKLPHIHKMPYTNYMEYYNDKTKEIIFNECSGDIEYFGFSFDSTATRNIGMIK